MKGTLEVEVEKNFDPWKVSLGFIVIKHFIAVDHSVMYKISVDHFHCSLP